MQARAAPREDSRTRILAAAQRLFTEHGADAVTMAEVARDAGVARATVFNQFGSKRNLIEAITEGVYTGYQAILDRALAARDTPIPALVVGLFEVMGRGIEQEPRFYRSVFREIAKITVGLDEGGPAQAARLRAIEQITLLLMRGQTRGELSGDFDVVDVATAFDSLVFGTISHWLYGDDPRPLVDRMRRAAGVLLGPVCRIPAAEYEAIEVELGVADDPWQRVAQGGPA